MKSEDLFFAIGQVEVHRLERSEQTEHSSKVIRMEEKDMYKRKTGRRIGNLLIAAVIAGMLGVTAFAVGGYLIFESPQQMLKAVFGDNTGFDHSDGSITKDPWGGPEGILVEPTYDRVPADEAVVEEDIAPLVSPVGQSISWEGYTLTVDAYMYDDVTRCGLLTYTLENPDGISYELQSNGEIWHRGGEILDFNQYGYSYIIQEKTTDTVLAATYYFQFNERRGDALNIRFSQWAAVSPEDIDGILEEKIREIQQEITPEEALRKLKEKIGPEYDTVAAELTEAELLDTAYFELAYEQVEARYTYENAITVPCQSTGNMKHITLGDGSIVIAPFCIRIDITDLTFLHTDRQGEKRVCTDNVKSVLIRYTDGTEYVVEQDYTMNHLFAHAEATSRAEENSTDLLTYMFNRIIDVDAVEAVVINGTVLPVD